LSWSAITGRLAALAVSWAGVELQLGQRERGPEPLGVPVAANASVATAIRDFQAIANLPVSGRMNAGTSAALDTALDHVHVAGDKGRTARLQRSSQLLGIAVDRAETKACRFGVSSDAAVREYRRRLGQSITGMVSPGLISTLDTDALRARFSSKTQIAVLQRLLTRGLRVAKVDATRSEFVTYRAAYAARRSRR
jgi:hypothetical protein